MSLDGKDPKGKNAVISEVTLAKQHIACPLLLSPTFAGRSSFAVECLDRAVQSGLADRLVAWVLACCFLGMKTWGFPGFPFTWGIREAFKTSSSLLSSVVESGCRTVTRGGERGTGGICRQPPLILRESCCRAARRQLPG
jgi:hypothetical protein